jgi:hypothetical protein
MGKLLLKILLNGIVVIPLLLWYSEAAFWSAAITAVALSIVAYFVGDQMILRASNNMTATIADALLAFAFLWLVAEMMVWSLTFTEITIIALLLGVVEFIFHRIIANDIRAR